MTAAETAAASVGRHALVRLVQRITDETRFLRARHENRRKRQRLLRAQGQLLAVETLYGMKEK